MNKTFSKIFMYLAIGLLISFGVAFGVSKSENLIYNVFANYYILLLVIELALAFVLSLFVKKLSKGVLTILYIAYSAITGLSLASIFLVYELSSIISVFLVTSIIFVGLAFYGYKTNKDITKLSTLLIATLFGIVLLTFINMFFIKNPNFDLLLTVVSMLVFMGFIMYDVNVLKRKLYDIEEDKLVIYGAFQLYLDFINLFLDLLRLFGKSND